jgi:predicted transcriptional regulator
MKPELTPLELQLLEAFWSNGRLSIREVQESFPEAERPAYSTIQTTINRLEEKGVVRRVRKIGNAQIFDAVLSRREARGRLLDDLLGKFGSEPQFVMAHMVESGKLTIDDIREAEKLLHLSAEKKKGGSHE